MTHSHVRAHIFTSILLCCVCSVYVINTKAISARRRIQFTPSGRKRTAYTVSRRHNTSPGLGSYNILLVGRASVLVQIRRKLVTYHSGRAPGSRISTSGGEGVDAAVRDGDRWTKHAASCVRVPFEVLGFQKTLRFDGYTHTETILKKSCFPVEATTAVQMHITLCKLRTGSLAVEQRN